MLQKVLPLVLVIMIVCSLIGFVVYRGVNYHTVWSCPSGYAIEVDHGFGTSHTCISLDGQVSMKADRERVKIQP